MPDEPTRDWAAQITDQIERVVSTVRDRTTRPALTVVRGLVFGIIAAAGAITALVLLSVVLHPRPHRAHRRGVDRLPRSRPESSSPSGRS